MILASFENEDQRKQAIEAAEVLPLNDLPKLIGRCYDIGRSWCGKESYYFFHDGSLYVIDDEDYLPIVSECRPVDSMTTEELEKLKEAFEAKPWEMPHSTVDDEQLINYFGQHGPFDPYEFRQYLEACAEKSQWLTTEAMRAE